MADMSLFEAIHTQRAIRHFRPDPVDDSLIEQMIEAATRAPSAHNAQPWRFIVIRDRASKAGLGRIFDELGQSFAAPDRTPWEDVPVLIAVCSTGMGAGERSLALEASVLPAVQNLLLTARALGLGTVLTTRWSAREPEVRQILGIPAQVHVHAIVPTGWPLDRFGRTRRKPVEEVTFRERWGSAWR
jgi:nitroreductase